MEIAVCLRNGTRHAHRFQDRSVSHSTTLIVGPQVFHFPSDLCAYARVAFDKQLAIKFGSITHAAEVRLLVGQTRPIARATVPALQNIADPMYDDRYLARETKVDKTSPRGQPRPSVQPRGRRSVCLCSLSHDKLTRLAAANRSRVSIHLRQTVWAHVVRQKCVKMPRPRRIGWGV